MTPPTVVDSHCHLDFEGMDENLPGILARAEEAGVGLMLSISSRVSKFANLLRIAEENPNVFCTVGTHPHNAHEELDVPVSELVRLTRHPKVVGIGEAGLDYHYDLSPREAQMKGFRNHIAAARETGLPLVIHTREAEDDTARVLEEEMAKGHFKAVLHCFTSQDWLAKKGVELGLCVSFSGILTYKTAQNLRDTARDLPESNILVETDSPYLAPVPHRGKSNEPAFVVRTLATLAETRGVPVEHMAKTTSDNFFRLFDKVPRPAGFA
ncbi:MAG: TatD family hydrolase [Phyllobacteriaceae bacterium]|nr:TatD family hydrolase [Phyllobacteriaceae bacterium]